MMQGGNQPSRLLRIRKQNQSQWSFWTRGRASEPKSSLTMRDVETDDLGSTNKIAWVSLNYMAGP